ncbi:MULTISPECIES: PTS sugar transporter subunit IIB [Romboutsia]|uniref:PTS system, Lactose/Cellobiose specific IIB subunit n=1 Tax=Romboutsia hominis TaxID=1507512 RepID=A0A2P2BY26_9FIRM|nr:MULTISPECIES: PTS sugar transporter subunit IIB [Romboutsia]MCH1959122.1 PTS sugar transporter subunit IIB [Romboutsia hominis]MCH1968242.1 PTS sugar transporter subunit IIB [Romboutsia hominis]MDB8789487.1 PTS sugar transporter subunit IIB [Romboutsia sp. 1001216sp1]MDB8793903.1 PTS sugar transporter subunit IIB [Romboutsia sp. 1001216sp1]MDB8796638.1 PTS sugar transporter subunit IIB [Romboutsia sp. 1001216sp1]
MVKIMLACSAGMSTSLLVTKMEAAAKEKDIEVEIWAISEVNLDREIGNCDVLLLGPQVRYILGKATEMAKPYNVPVEVINMMHYGTCNGKAVLDRAMELYNSK